MSTPTLACRLDVFDDAERARYWTLRRALKDAVSGVRELADGYALDLRPDAAVFRDVAEWVTLERRCCPFLTLRLEWSDAGAVSVTLTGGEGVKAILAGLTTAAR